MRTLLALLAIALLGAGCAAGPDGERAAELLAEARAAEAQVTSATFELDLNVSGGGQSFGVRMDGGAYLRGERAGDAYFELHGEGPLASALEAGFVLSRGRAHVRVDGAWQEIPLPEGATSAGAATMDSSSLVELAEAVTSVRVDEEAMVWGEPVTTIAGTLDMGKLLEAFAGMSGFQQLPGATSLDPKQIGEVIDGVDVLIALAEPSHRVRAAVIGFAFRGGGQTGRFELVYRVTSVNEPVAIPQIA